VVLVCHTAGTVAEEAVFALPGFHYGLFLSLTTMAAMTSLLGLALGGDLLRRGRSPLAAAVSGVRRLAASQSARHGLLVVFTSYTLSTALSKVALAYVSVPLQVVVKSSKLIPVMVAGRFVTGRVYTRREYVAALMLATGVACFSGGGGNLSTAAPAAANGALSIGLSLLAITLCADALLGNYQERTMRESALQAWHLQLCQSIFAAGLSLAASAMTGELGGGLRLLRHPGGAQLAGLLFVYAALMLVGTVAILALVERHGAAAAVLVTLLRKTCSMVASYILFPKAARWQHLVGALLVFASPYASQSKRKPPAQEVLPQEVPGESKAGV